MKRLCGIPVIVCSKRCSVLLGSHLPPVLFFESIHEVEELPFDQSERKYVEKKSSIVKLSIKP